MAASVVTRFAPSPTGRLHLGHAYSALFACRTAIQNSGRFLLRIEDIDFTRCKPEFVDSILEDLEWLGLRWDQPVRRQSAHLMDYAAVVKKLRDRDLLYPCFCTRKDIQIEIEAAGGAPHGPEGPLYPGTCRALCVQERIDRIAAGQEYALRLDVNRAVQQAGNHLHWVDLTRGKQLAQPELLGDVVLVRKDIGCSYHVAVVHDDALQEISLVTRGEDLFEATHLHRLLQQLLELPVPDYQHHPFLCDEHGRRLAKRDLAETLQSIRDTGQSAAVVRQRLGFD